MSRIVIYGNEFYHHGITGQKWGVRNGPPYPLKKELNGYKLKGPYKLVRASKVSTSKIDLPNSIVDYKNTKKNKITSRCFYDEKGVKFKEIHVGKHGESNKYGTEGIHVHEYEWLPDLSGIKKRTERPLTQEEKERNIDLYDKGIIQKNNL